MSIKKVPLLLFFLLILTGCDVKPTPESIALNSLSEAAVYLDESELNSSTAAMTRSASSLKPGSHVAALSKLFDETLVQRSGSKSKYAASQATVRARKLERYPALTPSLSAPLSDGSAATIGISVEQTIWDAGRVNFRLKDALLEQSLTHLEVWEARNKAAQEGLDAYITLAQYEARLGIQLYFKSELIQLSSILQTRASGGVGDRGELLRMDVALQTLEREILADEATVQKATKDLKRLLPTGTNIPSREPLAELEKSCSRNWPQIETPQAAIGRIKVNKGIVAEGLVKSQRFPKVIVGAGVSHSSGTWTEPVPIIRLDASDMLGIGRRRRVEAAVATTESMIAEYQLQNESNLANLSQLDADFEREKSTLARLQGLIIKTEENITLYKEQLNVGTIPITEGITLYREKTEVSKMLIDSHAEIIRNCVLSSSLRGILAPFDSIKLD